jgi:hypothetical protein
MQAGADLLGVSYLRLWAAGCPPAPVEPLGAAARIAAVACVFERTQSRSSGRSEHTGSLLSTMTALLGGAANPLGAVVQFVQAPVDSLTAETSDRCPGHGGKLYTRQGRVPLSVRLW